MENDKSRKKIENDNIENRRKKLKVNLFSDDESPRYSSKPVDNIFNIPNNIIIPKRSFKQINVVKENPTRITQNIYNIMKNIHSNDPLTLYELFNNLKKIKISEDLFIIIVRRCKEVLFRDIKNINPTGLIYYTGDDVNIRNKATSNINIFSKIFNYVTNIVISESIILKGFDDIDIFRLVNLLKSEDENERLNISLVLINIYKPFKYKINNLIENELSLFYEGLRTHVGIEEILDIVLCILENNNKKYNNIKYNNIKYNNVDNIKYNNVDNIKYNNVDNIKYKRKLNDFDSTNSDDNNNSKIDEYNNNYNNNNLDSFYFQYILRFLLVKNLEYYKIIPQLIYKYASEDEKISEFTLKYIYKIYLIIEYINKPVLIQIYIMIYVRWSRRIPFKNIKNDLCNMINQGLKSDHFVLIEEILQIIDNKSMKLIIQENIFDILPEIFDNLYNLSKKHWRSKSKMKIFKYISVILSMSHECFEKCLIKYNMKRFINRNEIHESLIDVLGQCIEHSELDTKKENEFNKRRKSMNNNYNKE